ncbi:hypothetical protein FWF89_00115 [Candidatus Saccharibacteria bacterium]|nr:hypothetical protein [Candidatus Saccharibacteria bacterium]
MAKQEESERPKYVRERAGKRLCYVENNFPEYKSIGKIFQWLDRSFDLIPVKSEEIAVVDEINLSIKKVLELAQSLEKSRGHSE